MTLSEWLDADRGRLTALAAHFNLTQSAVSQWRSNGVPPRRMKAVRDFTGGAVSLDDMLEGEAGPTDQPHPAPPPPAAEPAAEAARLA